MAEFDMNNVYGGEDLDSDEPIEDEPKDVSDELFDESDFQSDDDGEDEDFDDEDHDEHTDGEDEPYEDGDDSSPNFYRSIATALSEDGVLTVSNIDGIQSPDDLKAAIQYEIEQGISESNKRIQYALSNGVQPDEIQHMENVIEQLNELQRIDLEDESNEGVDNRKQIIYQGCIANGMTPERAVKEVDKSFRAGTDIDDARENLDFLIKSIRGMYRELVETRKREEEEREQRRQEYHENLAKSIIDEDGYTGSLSDNTKRRILDNLSRPTTKLRDGRIVTPIQKFQSEHPAEWQRITAELFTITDGFTDFSALGRREARKQINKGMANLEKALKSGSTRSSGGSYRYANNMGGDDPEENYDIEY